MDCSLNDVEKLLNDSNNILLTAHVNPDGDCLGSMLALNEYLCSIGKNVTMMIDDDIPSLYNFLPGSQDICKPTSQIEHAELLIVLDASDIERIGKVRECVHAPILNIDHHVSNTKFADYWYIDSKSAATGEIIFKLLKLLNVKVTSNMATSLYTAIATDCGFFRYANTSAVTMRYAADLIEYGAKPNIISENMETKSLKTIMALPKVLDTLEVFHDGQIATITISPEIVTEVDSTEGFINYARVIEGVELAIMFKVVSEDICRVSFRSKRTDVSQLALSFGGGGHARAAGCTVPGGINEVKTKVLAAAIKQWSEIKQ